MLRGYTEVAVVQLFEGLLRGFCLGRDDGTTAVDRSPAGHAHMPGDGGPVVTPIDDEVVALGLAVDGFADRRFERLIPFGLAQRGAQIGCVLLAEAHIESAGAGHPDAIAALAEI